MAKKYAPKMFAIDLSQKNVKSPFENINHYVYK